MATTIANLGAPAPTGNLLIVDGLNVAFSDGNIRIYLILSMTTLEQSKV